MQDQAERCLDLGIDTVVWNSETSEAQKGNIEKEMRSGEPAIKLLYTTPESLCTPRLAAALKVPLSVQTLLQKGLATHRVASTPFSVYG